MDKVNFEGLIRRQENDVDEHCLTRLWLTIGMFTRIQPGGELHLHCLSSGVENVRWNQNHLINEFALIRKFEFEYWKCKKNAVTLPFRLRKCLCHENYYSSSQRTNCDVSMWGSRCLIHFYCQKSSFCMVCRWMFDLDLPGLRISCWRPIHLRSNQNQFLNRHK